ncbi:MAG: acyl--CoA ligase [Nitrospirae bacterium]|nr:acyl--CoA ligase [Nitrospirota bacterium]
MNIFQTIKLETAAFTGKPAVVKDSYSITYGQLILSAELIASSLKQSGVAQFHRIGLLCSDSLDYITASLAILSLSAVVVPISTDHTENEISDILNKISMDFLVFEKGSHGDEGAFSLISKGFCTKEFYIKKRSPQEKPCDEYYRINPAFIRFSSGTTGTSKGIVLSHETIIDRTDAADKGLKITGEDTVLWVLSMSFHFVVTILLFLRRASTIVLCSSRFPEALIDGLSKHNGTFIYASPFHYSLLAKSDFIAGDSMKNIRMAVSTAMKLPEKIADEFFDKSGIELTEAYGIIEVGLPFINLSKDKSKRNSVGRPLPDYEVALFNLDENKVGTINIRGKGLLDAYFSPWQGRAGILNDGWFNTGDLGKIDDAGFLTIMGRDKEVINFAGMKVFPSEVEAVINQFPGVKESYVYGENHSVYGQLPMAKLVLQNNADAPNSLSDLRKYCYQKLAQYKVPKGFEYVSRLPKTASGKIKR